MYTIHTIFHFEFRSLPVKWSKVERWINSQLNRLLPHLSFSKRNQAKLFCLCCLLLQVVLVPLFFSVDNSNVLVDKGLINHIYSVLPVDSSILLKHHLQLMDYMNSYLFTGKWYSWGKKINRSDEFVIRESRNCLIPYLFWLMHEFSWCILCMPTVLSWFQCQRVQSLPYN